MDEYSQLIMDKLISNHEFNYAEIALGLAKINPRMFCELAKIDTDIVGGMNYTGGYYHIIDPYIRTGQHIQAIKELRGATGWGLKESKDYCDARRDQLGLRPAGSTTW